MIEFPDVNVLVALIDTFHPHHQVAKDWFTQVEPTGWATCSLTESGVVRVLTSAGFNNQKIKPFDASVLLRNLLKSHAATHHFIPDEARIVDSTRYNLRHLTEHNQVPDFHLIALCRQKSVRLVTLDNALRNSANALIQPPTNLIHFLLPLPPAAP